MALLVPVSWETDCLDPVSVLEIWSSLLISEQTFPSKRDVSSLQINISWGVRHYWRKITESATSQQLTDRTCVPTLGP